MGALLSKGKKGRSRAIDEHDKAVYDLKIQRDRMNKYVIQSRTVVEREMECARSLLKQGLKDRAKLVLRKKKHMENMIEKTQTKLLTVEELVNNIEYAKMQGEVMTALKEGNQALQALNKEIDLDEVEKLMDDTAEAIEFQNELDRLLGQELTSQDDEDVLAELEKIQDEEILTLKTELPTVIAQPSTLEPPREEQKASRKAASSSIVLS